MSIQILPTELANQIAAGEVVERPASVVKELVENSLDADASHIDIEVERGGHKRLCIKDDGKGVVKDQLALALSRHATSKIFNLDDLENIVSLGFRGEALASISSVSRLTFTSKPKNQDTAWQASTEGRDMQVKIEPAAYPQGTCIDVVDLFFNTPARRKFLRAEKTEFHHIDETLKRVALSRFDVSFTLKHNGKVVRKYPKLKDHTQPMKRIELVCGKDFAANSIYINSELEGMTLKGWLSVPSYTRPQNDVQYVYVNGRAMRDKLINHALRQAYEGLIAPNSFPAYVLFLDVNPQDVDVNVHPAKHEVRFHQARLVHDFIFRVSNEGLSTALQSSSSVNPVDSFSTEGIHILEQPVPDHSYIRPLQHHDYDTGSSRVSERSAYTQSARESVSANLQSRHGHQFSSARHNGDQASFSNYQSLMHAAEEEPSINTPIPTLFISKERALFNIGGDFYYTNLVNINAIRLTREFELSAPIKQPLLMPISIPREKTSNTEKMIESLDSCGVEIQVSSQKIMLKQVPSGTRSLNWADILFDVMAEDLLEVSSDSIRTAFYQSLAKEQVRQIQERETGTDFVMKWLFQQPDADDVIKQVGQKVPLQTWLNQFDEK